MKAITLFAGVLLGTAPYVHAAEPDYSSPYDTNPRCTERTVNSNAPECLVYSEGAPRQTYPPPKQQPTPPGTPTPPAAATPPASKPQAPRPGASK